MTSSFRIERVLDDTSGVAFTLDPNSLQPNVFFVYARKPTPADDLSAVETIPHEQDHEIPTLGVILCDGQHPLYLFSVQPLLPGSLFLLGTLSSGYIRLGRMVARGRFELPSMGLFLVLESKAHHWPGHSRPLLVHYTTGLQETRVSGQDPISLVRSLTSSFGLVSEQ